MWKYTNKYRGTTGQNMNQTYHVNCTSDHISRHYTAIHGIIQEHQANTLLKITELTTTFVDNLRIK